MATLINGDGNLAIAAAQDADWFASIMGNQTSITGVGHQFAAEVISATEIALSDGVIITKEGRRIQLDTDQIDTFDIPAGGADITNYYIIGYYLYRDGDSNELCEPFVELMDSSTATIEEDTFKGGADEVFVSLYRVTFTEFAISNVQALLPSIDSIRQITTSIGQINNDLTRKIIYIDKSLNFSDLTFSASYSGMYISNEINLTNLIPNDYTIVAISIASWTRLRTTDFVNGFISSDRAIKVYSNTNSFVSDGTIKFRILCIK